MATASCILGVQMQRRKQQGKKGKRGEEGQELGEKKKEGKAEYEEE